MKIDIIRIGNSRGVRIPAAILKQLGLTGQVELAVKGGGLLLKKPAARRAVAGKKPGKIRQGWEEAFKNAAPIEDDLALKDFLDAPFEDLDALE